MATPIDFSAMHVQGWIAIVLFLIGDVVFFAWVAWMRLKK